MIELSRRKPERHPMRRDIILPDKPPFAMRLRRFSQRLTAFVIIGVVGLVLYHLGRWLFA